MAEKPRKIFVTHEQVPPKTTDSDADPFELTKIKKPIEALFRGTDYFCEELLKQLAEIELHHEGLALFVRERKSSETLKDFTLMAVHNVNQDTRASTHRIYTFPISDDGMQIEKEPDLPGWDFFLAIREESKTPGQLGRISAILAISNTETAPKDFQSEHWHIINKVGDYLYWMINLQGFIERLSMEDDKTGAWNALWLRRKFTELERLRLEGRLGAVTLVFLDVDNFKDVNEKHGHLFADLAMGKLIEFLQNQFKKGDFVVRWGKGDEVVIVCMDATSKDILRRFMGHNNEKGLLLKAAEEAFSHGGESIDGFELSVGIAELKPGEESTLMAVLNRANSLQRLVKQTTKLHALADHENDEIARRQAMIAPK